MSIYKRQNSTGKGKYRERERTDYNKKRKETKRKERGKERKGKKNQKRKEGREGGAGIPTLSPCLCLESLWGVVVFWTAGARTGR